MSGQKEALVCRAWLYAAKAHSGQLRQSGEAYITHPLGVAMILAELKMDAYGLCAALLHDVIEDCDVSRSDLEREFGPLVARLVAALSKLSRQPGDDVAEVRSRSMRNLLTAMASDRRVIIIKLADRLHNIRTLKYLSPDRRRRIARETLDVYAPMARRAGLYLFYRDLADGSFAALYPLREAVVRRAIAQWYEANRELGEQMKEQLAQTFHESGVRVQIRPLQLSCFSTYRRLLEGEQALSEILGGPRFLLITENRSDCYLTLGMVHAAFTPRQGRVQDFISLTKSNNYQSLHTEVNCGGKWCLFAIQSLEMERQSRLGILADRPDSAQYRRLSSNLRALSSSYRPSVFLRNVRDDLRSPNIVAYSESGEPIYLPQGATVLDFAFAQDQRQGHRTVGCQLDGRSVPLGTELHNGARIAIALGDEMATEPAWLNWATTRPAREEIRQTLNNLDVERARSLGRQQVSAELEANNSTLEEICARPDFPDQLQLLGVDSLEQLLQQVGTGERLATVLADRLCNGAVVEADSEAESSVVGLGGVAVTYGICCYPLPGDTIRGAMKPGHGMVVHRRNCRKIREDGAHQSVLLDWVQQPTDRFLSALRLQLVDQLAALSKVTAAVAEQGISIRDIQSSSGEKSCYLELQLESRDQLWRLLRRLRALSVVHKAERLPRLED